MWPASACRDRGLTRSRSARRSETLATRHWFGWYALNVLDLPPHQIALQLGHQDGGRLVRELYGHPDAAIARERLREAVRSMPPVVSLPSVADAA
jgi:hypothetical protein